MRNYTRFQDKIDVFRTISVIKDLTCLVGNLSKASMKNDMLDFNVIKFFCICSRRLTGIVFARGLSSRARAPSFRSVCEYLKRSEQRGTLTAVCTPTIKSASEKHQR